ncbi:hypothetical protein ROZALSC1DRAFT_28064 [Rozella allomycis CSF55]|uniref:Uncharacterized protein n=1 Tax=Rozella allomycis (strain CSF55) TaxID=988480 RepID=A0A075ARK8_ROZAC|nr:hypothetical protein O9G_001048 [Rozella allomycis CSF55]RKP20453.1 hypothetical protein ROZALSC1DRAFT_28064 [Rozella allomycis CSF55]|eukprot:EPZ31137.1 hypothetical protein O9G_001048 [Rozella allomycis CSF55]
MSDSEPLKVDCSSCRKWREKYLARNKELNELKSLKNGGHDNLYSQENHDNLAKEVERLKKERGKIWMDLEREEELITNNLQKKMEKLEKEKEELETKLSSATVSMKNSVDDFTVFSSRVEELENEIKLLRNENYLLKLKLAREEEMVSELHQEKEELAVALEADEELFFNTATSPNPNGRHRRQRTLSSNSTTSSLIVTSPVKRTRTQSAERGLSAKWLASTTSDPPQPVEINMKPSNFYAIFHNIKCPSSYVLYHPLIASVPDEDPIFFISFSQSFFHISSICKRLSIKKNLTIATLFPTAIASASHVLIPLENVCQAFDAAKEFIEKHSNPVVIVEDISSLVVLGKGSKELAGKVSTLWHLVQEKNGNMIVSCDSSADFTDSCDLVERLMSCSELYLCLRPLTSGTSSEIEGQLILAKGGRYVCSDTPFLHESKMNLHFGSMYHFRWNDTLGLQCFNKGLSKQTI